MVWCMAKRVAETGVANGSHSAVPNVYHLEGGTKGPSLPWWSQSKSNRLPRTIDCHRPPVVAKVPSKGDRHTDLRFHRVRIGIRPVTDPTLVRVTGRLTMLLSHISATLVLFIIY
eukprot:6068780-Pyramimonas_sp.AAC.2